MGWDILTFSVPSSGVTIGSIEFEQLAAAKAWGYRIGRAEYWEDLSVGEKERLMAFERIESHMRAVIEHDAAKQQRARAGEARVQEQLKPQG
jgi:hypothetical protein